MASGQNRASDDRGIEARIARIKQELEQTAGEMLISWDSETLPPEERERFWRSVLAKTDACTTDFERLVNAGVDLPDPASLDDASVTAKLGEVIRHLARLRVFISQTDHLSDRQLYAHLWSESLHVETPATDPDPYSAWHVNLLGDGSEESTRLFMKFYANEEEREDWLQSFPDYVMPPRARLPFDRDRYLPQPYDQPDERDPGH